MILSNPTVNYYGTTHGHLEQSWMHPRGIGYGRAARYPVLGSITQAIDEDESIRQPIARLEVFVPQSRHYGKATIGSGCRLRTFGYPILIFCWALCFDDATKLSCQILQHSILRQTNSLTILFPGQSGSRGRIAANVYYVVYGLSF
jgi:hypothetical protein